MISHSIDNISYAREIFTQKVHTRKVGEYVIDREAFDTIVGLICTGKIPEMIDVKLMKNNLLQVTIPHSDKFNIRHLAYFSYSRKLASYAFLKNFKFRINKDSIVISNIDILDILRFIASGTNYKNIEENGCEYVLSR